MIRLLYFGWVRQRIGRDGEEIALPVGVTDVAGLVDHLAARGGGYAAAFAERASVRAAVNQALVKPDAAVADGDEVALFPPMTGGRP